MLWCGWHSVAAGPNPQEEPTQKVDPTAFEFFDKSVRPILAAVYGAEAGVWQRRWRLFFLATAGLFGDSGGAEWGVSHYRLRPG